MPPSPLPSRAFSLLQTVLFAGTILVSAFLLFWVQPLFAKMILPVLGGSSSVWTTSMLFFQLALLAGYVYAHCSSRMLTVGRQIAIHLTLLCLAFFSLPFTLDYAAVENPAGSPVTWVLSFAFLTVGLPFVMVSGSAPMLQRWFSLTRHRDRHNPYFLYGASNLGSMAALLLFPLLIEPAIGIRDQTRCWQTTYSILVVLFACCAAVTWRNLDRGAGPGGGEEFTASPVEPITTGERLAWIFLAFIPSSMMLGLTSHVTTDITPVSMFWIVPLALYLLSFVLVFSRFHHLLPNKTLAVVITLCTLILVAMRLAGFYKTLNAALVSIALHTALFFAAALLFHGYLSSTRPKAAYLTEYYLWLAIGGMLGGLFNAVVAPVMFNQVYEYYAVILVVFAFALRVLTARRGSTVISRKTTAVMAAFFGTILFLLLVVDTLISRPITAAVQHVFLAGSLTMVLLTAILAKMVHLSRRIVLAVMAAGIVGNFLVQTGTHANLLLARSFYGSLRIRLKYDGNGIPYHLFIHGSTRHNIQQDPASPNRPEPLMYYNRQANIGQAMEAMKAHLRRSLHLGVVGLGAGAASVYLEEGDTATFYEIDREVVHIATDSDYFTYLEKSEGRKEIVIGDARLQLRRAQDASFDILLIDAFASDAIPVHLLTAEALAMYLGKLKDDGVLIFHLSNRYLNLRKVMQGYRLPEGYALFYASKKGVEKPEPANQPMGYFSHSQIAVIARESALPAGITQSARWQRLEQDEMSPQWTDDFSNVLGVLRLGGVE
ncbi:MAG TPA: hypothetical protein DDY32_01870 [Desulfobulbaceae bacterium]|nr:hypothetical protein [Desulfobulbaceae bacterium]